MEFFPKTLRTLARAGIELGVIALVCFLAYSLYPQQVRTVWSEAYSRVLPCNIPVTYKIGTIDPHFGLSQAQVREYLDEAAQKWNTAAGKNVLRYDQQNGVVVVSFVYDYRQQATATLKNLGVSLNTNQDSYDQLRAQYDSLQSDYKTKKAALDTAISSYQEQQASYNSEVQMWNQKGGAPPSVYKQLQQEKSQLESLQSSLQQQENSINAEVDQINALAQSLNTLIDSLNLQVAKYNSVGASTGGEFEEGLYQSRFGSQTIDIYEFNTTTQLKRVLAHEFGHAIGLEHVDDPDAIMYKLNESSNTRLTAADITELKNVCRLH